MEERKSPQEGQYAKNQKFETGAKKEISERKIAAKKNLPSFQQEMWLAS